ncbi:MAG: HdeD family acid-resistance protein [Candidatus Acidiferrales bacterium]
MAKQSITDVFKEATGLSIGWSVVMIALGILAVVLPTATGIGVSVVVAWIIILTGLAYLAYAFAAQGAGSFLWRMLIGLVYVVGGGYLAFHSALAVESLTLVVAVVFFLEGVLEIAAFFQLRALPGAGWILFDGIVALALAYVIWRPWPSSSTWAIGILVGVNLIVSGITGLLYSVTARKALKAIA